LTPFLLFVSEEEAESLDFGRLLLSLLRPAVAVPTPSTSSCVFGVDELLSCVRVVRVIKDAVAFYEIAGWIDGGLGLVIRLFFFRLAGESS
jgi:hypothetical protein